MFTEKGKHTVYGEEAVRLKRCIGIGGRSYLEVCATHLIAHILCSSCQLFYLAPDAWVRPRQLPAIVEELQMPGEKRLFTFFFFSQNSVRLYDKATAREADVYLANRSIQQWPSCCFFFFFFFLFFFFAVAVVHCILKNGHNLSGSGSFLTRSRAVHSDTPDKRYSLPK